MNVAHKTDFVKVLTELTDLVDGLLETTAPSEVVKHPAVRLYAEQLRYLTAQHNTEGKAWHVCKDGRFGGKAPHWPKT